MATPPRRYTPLVVSAPFTAHSVDGEVVLLSAAGSNVSISMTPHAAIETARRMVEAAEKAERGIDTMSPLEDESGDAG